MPDYDDGLVEKVAKAIALETMGWVPDEPVKLDSRIYIDEDAFIEPARIARAAIAAVLEWQGKGTAADELRRAMEILNSPTPPATVEALRERLNRGLR